MRIVFMGSASFSCPSLERLVSGGIADVVGVVTQPDRPKGRGLEVSSSPVNVAAGRLGIPVLTPANANAPESVARIRSFNPDLIVVVAYGQILRKEILTLPPKGCVNIHASLLPKYRGAAPIQWAIANGDETTGVTAMFMNERMDAGDILLQKKVAIARQETAGILFNRLAEEGADALLLAVQSINDGRATRTPQVEADATYAPKLGRDDGRIDWTKPGERIYNQVRAFNPWPSCFCMLRKESRKHGDEDMKLKILAVRVEDATGTPGEVLDVSGDGPLVAAREKSVRILEVQPEGKKVMTGRAFLCGHAMKPGDRLN